jgi:uncharacterized membrane protein
MPEHHEHGEHEHRSRHRRSEEDRRKSEEEISAIANDPEKLAREVILLKKELNRLHYKVKSGFSNGRKATLIGQVIIVCLLLVVIGLIVRN